MNEPDGPERPASPAPGNTETKAPDNPREEAVQKSAAGTPQSAAAGTQAGNGPKERPPPHAGARRPPAAAPPPRRDRPRRGAIVVAVIALILALIAWAGIGVLAWTHYQSRGEAARISRLESRVSALSGRLASVDKGTASAKSLTQLAGQLDDLRRGEKQRLDAMAKNLHALGRRIAGAGTAYRADEATGLMRLAQARLVLESDPAGAARALELADKALAAANDPSFAPVHLALQREIAALEAVPKVDIDKAYVKLETLLQNADSLPLAGSALAREPAAAGSASAPARGGIAAAFKRAFSPLIVVRHGKRARPLLPPRESWFVRQNLKLALESAQLALLQGNAKAWHASVAQARRWLSVWFAGSNAQVKRADKNLTALAALDIAPRLPTLGAAMARLKTVRSQAPIAASASPPANAAPAPKAVTTAAPSAATR